MVMGINSVQSLSSRYIWNGEENCNNVLFELIYNKTNTFKVSSNYFYIIDYTNTFNTERNG